MRRWMWLIPCTEIAKVSWKIRTMADVPDEVVDPLVVREGRVTAIVTDDEDARQNHSNDEVPEQ